MKSSPLPLVIGTIFTLVAGTAGAATMHRFDLSSASGSGGATAVVQSSPGGGAIQGQIGGPVDTSFNVPFGVFGEAFNHDNFGIGVVGVSYHGYGVGAEGIMNNQAIVAESFGGDTIDTISPSGDASLNAQGIGISTYTAGGTGAQFSAQNGYGVVAAGDRAGSFNGFRDDAVDAYTSYGNYGIYGYTNGATHCNTCKQYGGGGALGGLSGQGLIAYGRSGGSVGAIEGTDTVGGSNLISTYAYNGGGTPAASFMVQGTTANASGHTTGAGKASDVQISGDVYVSGNVYQSCGTYPETSSSDCGSAAASTMRASNGKDVRVFAARESAPMVEDVGVSHLFGGRVHVAIDAAFGRAMSREVPYHVFLTPDGPSRGVYAMNRTATGFDIAENPGGQSTVDVEYRIVATPFADRASRLATLPQVHKTALASEALDSRGIANAKAAQADVVAQSRRMDDLHVRRRASILQAAAALPRER